MGADAYCEVIYTKVAKAMAAELGHGWTGKATQWFDGRWGVTLKHSTGITVDDCGAEQFSAHYDGVTRMGATPGAAFVELAAALARMADTVAAVAAQIPAGHE